MKIGSLKIEKRADRVRASARVIWEDYEHEEQEIYVETIDKFAQDFTCNPDSFLLACALPAMHYGEQRIHIDDEVCPALSGGLVDAMNWIRHWENSSEALPKIEAKYRSRPLTTSLEKRAGVFFSGGVDSLATLRTNRLRYPLEHPEAIRDGLMVYGINIESDNRPEVFEQAVTSLSEVAEASDITLIPLYTNFRELNTNLNFYVDKFMGPILLAAAHALTNRLSSIYIASGGNVLNVAYPEGSHPFLDPSYGSSELRVFHDGISLSRLDKLRLLTEWDVARRHIKVCPEQWPGDNCGKCTKCLLTMTGLLALNQLSQTPSFPNRIPTPAELRLTRLTHPATAQFYYELVPPLRDLGHRELAEAIQETLNRFQRKENIKQFLKSIDRIFLNSRLMKIKKRSNVQQASKRSSRHGTNKVKDQAKIRELASR